MPVAVAVALLAAFGSLIWAYTLQNRLTATEAKLQAAQQGTSAFSRRLAEADARMRANSANVDQQLTEAQQQQAALAVRAQDLSKRQQADTSRIEKTQAATEQKFGSVATDVAATRSDVESTKTDLADTKTILQRTIGDAGVMSGLIAHNHDELETLKHRGDRSYYEFTLHKNAPASLFATIKLQLKKTNEKKSRFTMLVSSDDRDIEKKDKTVFEPIQFYTGKNPVLYEVVINSIGKDVISGYLSTPRGM